MAPGVDVLPTAVAAIAPRTNDSAAAQTITRRMLALGWSAFSSAGMVSYSGMMNGWLVLNEVIYSSTRENDEVSGALLFRRSDRHETRREGTEMASLQGEISSLAKPGRMSTH